ncbi:hypothetical protein DITRI_Ditri04bG0147300 [Diplodiscus trichospermus]
MYMHKGILKIFGAKAPAGSNDGPPLAGRNALPNKVNLQLRVIDVPLSCVVCNADVENNWHLFITCPYAQQCWYHAQLLSILNDCSQEGDGFTSWLFKVIATVSEVKLGKYGISGSTAMICFGTTLTSSLDATVNGALVLLCDWLAAQNSSMQRQCNVDASLFADIHSVGIGMFLRNDARELLTCRVVKLSGLFSVKEAETLGLFEAISW